ncbi:GntR family transcriptional regulator [Kutzneria viridogrisea]|uniref:DNA-binding GntR family transcriptional regulator n=1 Tax=Kutzneria viridogrisea TaxID=47990 RepID=A0ABR6BFE3_9PSEU|nr:DNA-binding GntR family transcriptional regulator [Kutzneria viridogrisea]
MNSGRDKAYEYLRDTILADPASQGQFISEQEVADRVGVSRTPVREALLLLAAEELVRLVPKRGAYVAPMTAREITELVELRGLLERHAAEQALASGAVPLAELREALDRQRAEPEVRQFIDWDRRFHTALVAATGNAMLTRVYTGLGARQVRAGLTALHAAADRREAVLTEHEAILTALAANDPAAARAAITAHLDSTLRVLLAGA